MDEMERACLLQGDELLFLLSLADSRPAIVPGLPAPTAYPAVWWEQVAVKLQQSGLVQYTESGLAPPGPVPPLLPGITDADPVCAASCRAAGCKTQALYLGGRQGVLLEGTLWPGYRLRNWDAPPGQWLDGNLGLPDRVPGRGPALPEGQLAPDLADRPFPAFGEAAPRWGALEQARTILDVYRVGRLEERLVWWHGAAGWAVLGQTQAGSRLTADCQPVRQALKQQIWKGGPT